MWNIEHAMQGGIFLYAKLHLHMEPQGPQHLPEFDSPQVAQFPHFIWKLYGLHEDEKNSHDHAYVTPLLI
jgi:hypothetical protein